MSEPALCEACSNAFAPGDLDCQVCGTPRVSSSVAPVGQVGPAVTAPAPVIADRSGEAEDRAAVGWVCECGYRNGSNPFCDGCSAEEPDGRLEARATVPALDAPALVLTLPDGSEHGVLPGVPTHLGREGDDPALVAALQDYGGVSRSHATITVAGTCVTVTDHGSMNGTVVNGAQVSNHVTVPLRELRTVRLGRYAVIHARLGEGVPHDDL